MHLGSFDRGPCQRLKRVPRAGPPGVLRQGADKVPQKGCKVKTNETRYSAASKSFGCIGAFKAQGNGVEAQVAHAYGVYLVTLAK